MPTLQERNYEGCHDANLAREKLWGVSRCQLCKRETMRVVTMPTLQGRNYEGYHDAKFLITGSTRDYDNLWCCQWWKSWHHDNPWVSVNIIILDNCSLFQIMQNNTQIVFDTDILSNTPYSVANSFWVEFLHDFSMTKLIISVICLCYRQFFVPSPGGEVCHVTFYHQSYWYCWHSYLNRHFCQQCYRASCQVSRWYFKILHIIVQAYYKLFWYKRQNILNYLANTMSVDALAPQVARASVDAVLTV